MKSEVVIQHLETEIAALRYLCSQYVAEIGRLRGGFHVTTSHACEVLINDACEHDSDNFRTYTVHFGDETWTVTTQRAGGLTPDQHIQGLRLRVAQLQATLASVTGFEPS